MTGTTFGQALAAHAADRPDAPAVTCGAASLTWGELERDSNRLARAYAAAGVTQGSYVSIALENSPQFLSAAFAAWKLGAVPQPLSARITTAELEAIVEIVQPAGVVGVDVPGFVRLPSEVADGDDGPLPAVTSPAWKAPTSGGSTGRPKVIVATSPAEVEQVVGFATLLQIPERSTVVIPGPLHHNAPFMFTTLSLLIGSHVVLQPRFDAETVLRDISERRATWLYAVPTMMQRIWRLDPEVRDGYDLSSLQRVVHMAAPCPPWLKLEWIGWLGGERILEIYAGTEAQAATRIDGNEWLTHQGSVGRPAIGELRVLDADGTELPTGEVGQVWMRRGEGAPPAYRYLGAEAKVREGGWEYLGDLGRVDEDGFLYLTDRDTDMILVGGSNVYPAEVEAALDEHPAITSSCVIGLPHEDLGAVPHAIVQTDEDLDLDALTAFLRDRLSAYKVPRTFELVTHPLRDDAGKVRRSALRAERLP